MFYVLVMETMASSNEQSFVSVFYSSSSSSLFHYYLKQYCFYVDNSMEII